ncbi:MAG: methyl-accepting chemotaxis protein, partial [Oceanospirillales bacterium]
MKLSSRVILALSLPLMALLIISLFSWVQFGRIYNNVNTIYKDRVIPLQEL